MIGRPRRKQSLGVWPEGGEGEVDKSHKSGIVWSSTASNRPYGAGARTVGSGATCRHSTSIFSMILMVIIDGLSRCMVLVCRVKDEMPVRRPVYCCTRAVADHQTASLHALASIELNKQIEGLIGSMAPLIPIACSYGINAWDLPFCWCLSLFVIHCQGYVFPSLRQQHNLSSLVSSPFLPAFLLLVNLS